MAKYNLLDDDDIFEEKKEKSGSAEKEPTEIDIKIDNEDDFDIEPASLEEDEFQTDIIHNTLEEDELESVSGEYEEDPQFDNEPAIEKVRKEPTTYLSDDYEDDKQEGINYKPILKIAFIIIGLVAVYFLLTLFVFTNDEPVVEEPVKTEEELRLERIAAEKAAFISTVSGKLNSDVQNLSSTINDVMSVAKISSVLYYGNSFLFEVFGSSRNDVAKVNMAFKKAGRPFEIISSQTRPGSRGGVISLYRLEPAGSGSNGQSAIRFGSVNEFENWLQQTSTTAKLKIVQVSNKAAGNESGFNKYQIETIINGPLAELNNFLKNLSSDANQIEIHKLNLSALDQRTFNAANYQLKLILEIFV
jgi:hypothetical protein